jgi:hypothetical protein
MIRDADEGAELIELHFTHSEISSFRRPQMNGTDQEFSNYFLDVAFD